ncbi:MAG TPA: signal peptidase I [Patescibacteria group bacterium]|nr:signal peptidase I [Patescibacteria group bacterium]
MNSKNYIKGTFWQRLAAFIIDALILFVPIFIWLISSLYLKVRTQLIIGIVNYVIIASYNVFFLTRTSSTIGKKILRLKVVNSNYEKANIKTILLREVVGKFISQAIFSLGYIWALGNPKRQTWHDKIAKTYVVRLDKEHNLTEGEDKQPTKVEKILFYAYTLFVIISVIIGLFFGIVGRPVRNISSSMEPNYKQGAYYLTTPPRNIKRADVVVYTVFIKGRPVQFIKRVIGLPGEKIALYEGRVYINGKVLYQLKYLSKSVTTSGGAFLKDKSQIIIPKGTYFVMGDNRSASLDSRDMGYLPGKNITGKIWFCYWNCQGSKGPKIIGKRTVPTPKVTPAKGK